MPGELDVRMHDRPEKGHDQDHKARGRTQVYTRWIWGGNSNTSGQKNDDLKKKLKVFMGFPATGGEDDCTCQENCIIIDDTDSDPDDSDDDFVDEAWADIMESLTDQNF